MIYLSQLEKLLKHNLVLEYYEQGIESMCMKEFLPLCAALLYPYRNEKFLLENTPNGNIMPIIESIKSFTKKTKGLEKYCLDGLRKYFQYKWLPTLDFDNQKRLIKGVSLIDKVEDNGFFSIRGNEKVYDTYLHRISVLDISTNYGNDTFEIPQGTTIEDDDMTDRNVSTDNVSLSELKGWLLINFPINTYPKGLNQFPYFWQYKLSQDQYRRLKEILLSLNLNSHKSLLKVEPCGKGFGTVARVVALFVSEWYKRESTSLRGDHCLRELDLSGDSSSIWNGAVFPSDYLHKEDDNDREMRQTAMCTLGGLPLQYVYQSDRFRQFVDRLFNLKNNEEETTDEDIESIVDCFNDTNQETSIVFKRSLKSGSCKEYLIKLVDYLGSGDTNDLPFSERDLEIAPFSNFMTILQEGYDEALPNKILQKEIRIWTYDYMEEGDDSDSVECEFFVYIGFLKSNNVITTRELSKLGILLPPEASMFDARLKITMKDGSCIIKNEKRTYHKIGNHCDDFCGAFGSSLATSIDFFNTKDIDLLIECGDYCKEIPLYTIPSCLELYATNNGFLWTTKTNNAAQKVVFYDKSIYTLQNNDIESLTKSDDENYWGWIYQTETITLIDSNGGPKTIGIGESELILVDFKVKSLRKTIELSKDGCVECVIQDDGTREIPLLYFDDRKRPLLACDGLKGNDLCENYKIEFKKISDHNYSEWTTNNYPPQGILSIRISCRDESKKKKPRKLDVYFIPGTYPIVKRNFDNNYIYIKGEYVCILDESLKNNLTQTDDEFNYKYKDSCDNLKSSSIHFRMGDDDNHIILKVYRAFNWTQILNIDKIIKDITNDGSEKPPIALILQKNIHLQVIDEGGYNIYSPCYQRYLNYFRDPRTLSFVKQRRNSSGFYIDETTRPYLYYVYMSNFDDNGKIRKIEKNNDDRGNEFILLHVSEDYIKEYNIYYWDGETEHDPVKLEPAKICERTYRFDIPSPISEKALVFQSLKDCSPNLYFRPFYQDVIWDNYVQRYDLVSIDYIIKCYQLAVEHNVCFCVFPAIRNLQKRNVFTEFIRKYAILKNYLFSDKDIECLTRLGKELAMDWFFVNRNALYRGLDEDSKHKIKECLRRLLLHSPIARHERAYSIDFIDRWFLANNRAFNQRDGRLFRKFLRALDQFNSYDGNDNIDNRINLLNQLITNQNNIFQEICNLLNI